MTTEKKVALVTGANKGLGLEIARQLGKQGIVVALGARGTGNIGSGAGFCCAQAEEETSSAAISRAETSSVHPLTCARRRTVTGKAKTLRRFLNSNKSPQFPLVPIKRV